MDQLLEVKPMKRVLWVTFIEMLKKAANVADMNGKQLVSTHQPGNLRDGVIISNKTYPFLLRIKGLPKPPWRNHCLSLTFTRSIWERFAYLHSDKAGRITIAWLMTHDCKKKVCLMCQSQVSTTPWKIKWNLKITCLKRNVIFQIPNCHFWAHRLRLAKKCTFQNSPDSSQ